jgi:hypothetical protein
VKPAPYPDKDRTNKARKTKHKNRAQMKSETKSRKDDLVKQIGALAKDAQKLARIAVQQYSAEVEAVPTTKKAFNARPTKNLPWIGSHGSRRCKNGSEK